MKIDEVSIAAGFKSLASSATVTLANNKGNLKKTLKDMGKTQFVRGIATAMVVAGATYGISDALGVSTEPAVETVQKGSEVGETITSTAPTFFEEVRDRLVQSSINTGVATSVQMITEDLKWKDALKQGVINTSVSSLGALGANKLSLLYNGGKGSWNYAAHKVGHFVVGGLMGATSNYKDPFKGFLSGGTGAMCAEVIMEGLPSTMRMSDRSRLTRALVGTGTFLAGGNVTISDLTATNAIENNSFMPSPYAEVQEQQYKNMKATGEYLTNLLGEDVPGFADAREWFSSGCDVLNDMYFGLLPGISPENRAFMENQLPWNMAIDLIPAKVGEVGLVAAPLLRTGGQGAKAVFKALPSKGLTQSLATESGHALRVYTTRELAGGAFGGRVREVNPNISLIYKDKGLYDSHNMRDMLESRYHGKVSSITVPQANQKNVKLAGQRHPESDVVFNMKGLPIFDDIAVFETKISSIKSSIDNASLHKRAATQELRKAISDGIVSPELFTQQQLAAIQQGKPSIPQLRWHHHQDIGRMQLISDKVHDNTGHIGGMNLWPFKNE